jgi:putative transposase
MTSPSALEYGTRYHIFTRGINRENIFFEERNYFYFMGLCHQHIGPIAEVYAYCLLRNHIHFFLRIKTKSEIMAAIDKPTPGTIIPTTPPGQRIGNFLNAYAKSINHAYHRTGSLFQHPFGRIPVRNQAYYSYLMNYIHNNPQHHGFVKDFRDWPFSSYHTLVSKQGNRQSQSIHVTYLLDRGWEEEALLIPTDIGLLGPLVAGDFF